MAEAVLSLHPFSAVHRRFEVVAFALHCGQACSRSGCSVDRRPVCYFGAMRNDSHNERHFGWELGLVLPLLCSFLLAALSFFLSLAVSFSVHCSAQGWAGQVEWGCLHVEA